MQNSIIQNNLAHIPFDKIKNSKVIIYGMGDNGQHCYGQILHSKYSRIVGICDKKINGNFQGKWISKDEIVKMNFNYIFISILDKKILHDVYNNFLAMGIEQKKILHMYMGYNSNDNNIDVWTENILASRIEKQINSMYKIAKKPEEYLLGLGDYILKKIKSSILLLKKIAASIQSDINRIIFLKYIYEHGIFDDDCMKIYMKSLISLKCSDDTLYGLVIDTTMMQFKHPMILYADYFKDRMELQIKLCSYYNLSVKEGKKQVRKIKNIAIVAQRFCNKDYWDATSRIVFLCSKELNELGYNIKIFDLCSMQRANEQRVFLEYPSGMNKNTLVRFDKQNMAVNVYNPISDDVSERLNQNINAIDSFNPDLIIDMADEMFIEGYILNKKYYIINIPMRAMSYSSFASKYIAFDIKNIKKDMKKFMSIDDDKFIDLKLCFTDNDDSKKKYKRKEYGFSQEDFLIVTVGTRLRYEIDIEMVQNMIDFLERNKRARWILVGDGAGDSFIGYDKYFEEKRIIEWGMEKNLMPFYGMCDAYVNPKRKGGGLSIRQAMMKGLPVITCDYESDALIMMKDSHIVKGGYEEMMLYMERLMRNTDFYIKIKEETINQFKNCSFRKDVQNLINYIESDK